MGTPFRALKLKREAILALEATCRKIAVVFFYKHVGHPLGAGALVGAKIKPNLLLEEIDTLGQKMKVMRFPAVHKRGPHDFLGQFIYSWDYNAEQGLFGVSAKFGEALIGMTACAERPDELSLEEVMDLYRLDGSLARRELASE